MRIITTPLVRFGPYALVDEHTVLHQLIHPDEPAYVRVGHHIVRVPKPNLPIHELVNEQGDTYALAVTLGPPWSLLDDAVCGDPDAKRNLATWLVSAIRDALVLDGSTYYRNGVMGFAKGDPRIPEGEVWIGTDGISLQFRTGVAIRYPIASPTSAKRVVVKACSGTGIWINDHTLVTEMQGDSDGDLLMVIAEEAGIPEWAELPAEPPVDFAQLATPHAPSTKSRLEIALGHKAREAVGLLTWQAWIRARTNADRAHDQHGIYQAWAEAYEQYTEAIEACMDGRKDGRLVTPDQFHLMPDSVPHVLFHGTNNMVRSRWRTPIPLERTPQQLLREYWSGQWSGLKPVNVEGGE